MAKTMKFKDDKTYGFADSSTALDCVAVVKTFAELDAIRAEFTEDNLKGGRRSSSPSRTEAAWR